MKIADATEKAFLLKLSENFKLSRTQLSRPKRRKKKLFRIESA